MNQWLWIGGLLGAVALFLWILLEQQRRRMGMPGGKQVYDDLTPFAKEPQVLFSERYHLSGKPDAIFEDANRLVPVEIKSGKAPRQPYPAHVTQLMAYCLLIEAVYERRPSYGLLRYRDKDFKISYTIERENRIKRLIEAALNDADAIHKNKEELHRSHNIPRRCMVCGYRERCDEKIEAE